MPAHARNGLSGVLRRLLMRPAVVVAREPVAGGFHLLTLEGPALREVAWTPGQKVQIAMAATFTTRTYTPIDWDIEAGRFRMLGYAHAEGPGSAWVRTARPGDDCDVFGPRGSIDVGALAGPLVVFGDETSIGLVRALASHGRATPVTAYLEVDDPSSASAVLERLRVADAMLFERRSADAHLEGMEAALPKLAATDATFVLTGKAGTIQRLRHGLKRLEVPTARIESKAYWAPGKTGLD